MAGIGFELRKLMAEETFIGDMRAYVFAGVISAGPWLISIVALAFLWTFSYPDMLSIDKQLLRVTVVYSFAYSLITTGVIQLVITRFLADRLYLKQKNILLPTYVGLMALTVVIQGISASIYYSFFQEVSLNYKITAVMLYVAISCIWQTMIFLTASRDYLAVVWAFLIGAVVSFFGALYLGAHFGMDGHLLGFTLGQILFVFLLMWRMFYEFDSTVSITFDFLRQMPKYVDLLLMGIFYYLAVWVDKMIYWYSPGGEHIADLFYTHYPYDSCMFIAFVTIVPALAHFLVDVETHFYECYKGFYGAIMNRGSYQSIMLKKKEMVQTLFDSGSRMVVLQTMITVLFLFFAPQIAKFLSLRPEDVSVLYAAAIGAYFHAFLLVLYIVILYFDRKRGAMYISLFFLVTNASFTLYVLNYAPEMMGIGYMLSAFLSFCFALGLLIYNIRNIEYITFTEQPLEQRTLPKEPSSAVRSSQK